MKVKTLAVLAGLGGSLLLASAAQADYLGLTWEEDAFGLNGVTPLITLPGYAGERVINVYASFDNPLDQAVGVTGSNANPFNVVTNDGSNFINEPDFGEDTPPSIALAGAFPALNWDSFYTIGAKFSNEQSTELIIAPGTPGPNDVDSPGGVWGNGNTNMSWLVPPTIDGVPTPESVAGADGRVLLMRLVVNGGAGPQGPTEIMGTMGVLIFTDAGPAQVAGAFNTIPAPGALALLGLAGLAGTRRRRR